MFFRTAEAFVYLFLSAWLAIHASVSCHSFSVRLILYIHLSTYVYIVLDGFILPHIIISQMLLA